MLETSFLAAFLGGILALLSPCSALLLPAFFAYSFQSPRRLLSRTVIFWLGLSLTLVPLGAGSSAIAAVFFKNREAFITGAGSLIIIMGLLTLFGQGFAFAPLQRVQSGIRGDSWGSTLALGAVYGLAGFCSGPILGAILTLAGTSGNPVTGGALLAVYAAGMSAPLLLLAGLWNRYQLGTRGWLRGREIRLGRLRVHSMSLISGLIFIALGVAFIAFQGMTSLDGAFQALGAADLAFKAENWLASVLARVPAWLQWLLSAALLAWPALHLLRRAMRSEADTPAAGDD
jgi:cytochrome c biogenesis protein CcdA